MSRVRHALINVYSKLNLETSISIKVHDKEIFLAIDFLVVLFNSVHILQQYSFLLFFSNKKKAAYLIFLFGQIHITIKAENF